MSTHHDFHMQNPLRDLPALLKSVRRGFKAAQAEGAITNLRATPTGDEACVYIGAPANPGGFATFYDVDHGRVWLDVLYVHPDFRRLGIATGLLALLETSCAAAGWRHILFGTSADNAPMRALIEKKRGLAVDSVEYRIDLPDFTKRKCRSCSCTQNNACMTEDGPCWWVAPDLCSGCAAKEK